MVFKMATIQSKIQPEIKFAVIGYYFSDSFQLYLENLTSVLLLFFSVVFKMPAKNSRESHGICYDTLHGKNNRVLFLVMVMVCLCSLNHIRHNAQV